jgi:SAM-dependent methyltransferase
MALRKLVDRFLEHPFVYRVWQAPFVDEKFAPVERHLRLGTLRRVLDVGCGPGTNAARFAGLDYVGVDVNDDYLALARSKYQGQFIQADLGTADLSRLGAFDAILINSFLHHLPDEDVDRILTHCEKLLAIEGAVHILELVLPRPPSLATLMARFDRGRYARTLDHWNSIFERHFSPQVIEPYTFGGGLWAMLYFQGRARG